jgi:hypothetical protein
MLVGLLVALFFVNNEPAVAENSQSTETTIRATVVSIELPVPQQESIDASEDFLEPGKCWVVRVRVDACLPGGFVIEDQTLNLLVHSPSESLGVSQKGQVVDVRLERSTTPIEFRAAPGRSGDLSQLPDIQNRRFKILTLP